MVIVGVAVVVPGITVLVGVALGVAEKSGVAIIDDEVTLNVYSVPVPNFVAQDFCDILTK
jgi:hypothetical protein